MRRAAAWMLGLVLLLVAGLPLLLCAITARAADSIPPAAAHYAPVLKREAQFAWGLQAPVATLAAQVHQESHWRPGARSAAGAEGLAQFMPTTADWLGGLYQSLGDRTPMNPTWALRAMVLYDRRLHDSLKADTECERMAFTLAAYNGGLGWVYKRQKRSAQPGVCLGGTCSINPGISAVAQRENEAYPQQVLKRYEPLYLGWGAGSCS